MAQAVNNIENWLEEEEILDATIFIRPPTEEGAESEQDSDNDDQPTSLNHLSSRQLAADVDVHIRTINQTDLNYALDTNNETEEQPPQTQTQQLSQLHNHQDRKWQKGKFCPKIKNNTQLHHNNKMYSIDKATDFFELFFDDELVDFICECSLKYAQQQGNHTFQLDRVSLKAFLGILLLSGYCDLPR